jgi:exodeoxyribonuclease X
MKQDQLLRKVLVLDTECTHADPGLAEIVEMAVAKWHSSISVQDKLQHTWQYECEMFGSTKPMPPEASAVTHIHPSMLLNKPTFVDSMDTIMNMLVSDRPYFVSHNVKYDRHVITSHLKRMEPELADMVADVDRWICTLRLSRRLWPNFSSHAQNFLRYALDLDVSHDLIAHRAEPDTKVCVSLFERCVQECVHQGLIDVNEDWAPQLVKLTQQPVAMLAWPFGKHKGKLFADLDTDYLLWALDNMKYLNEQDPDFNPDLAESVRVTLESRLLD